MFALALLGLLLKKGKHFIDVVWRNSEGFSADRQSDTVLYEKRERARDGAPNSITHCSCFSWVIDGAGRSGLPCPAGENTKIFFLGHR